MGDGVHYVESECRTALNVVRGMPYMDRSLNPYVGCEHACRYCFAREFFTRAGKDPGRGFDRVIEARMNIARVLARELRRPHDGAVVAIGTATDPYQPAEGRFRLTRACLEVIAGQPIPPAITIITKGTLIVRDAALLGRIARRGEVSVLFSIGSVDARVARELEPDAPPPRSRLRAVGALRDAGVKACVICAPIVPGLGDGEAQLEAVARAARDAGAYAFHHRILKLDPSVKPMMLEYLRQEHPALAQRYEARYANMRLDPEYARVIEARLDRIRARYRFPADDEPPRPAEPRGQLRLAM